MSTFQPTEEMIQAYAEHFKIDLTDGSQRPGVEGSLIDVANGKSAGNKMAPLLDSPETREVFAPLREAFFYALGYTEMPAYSNVHSNGEVSPAPTSSEEPGLTGATETQE